MNRKGHFRNFLPLYAVDVIFHNQAYKVTLGGVLVFSEIPEEMYGAR